MSTCQRYYEVLTLASDCLSDSLLTLCAYARRSERNQSFVSNGRHITDLESGHHRLRSVMTTEYDISRTRTQFGDRAFSVAESREWNVLPADIRNMTDSLSFKRAIKTYFFYWHIRIKQFYFSRTYYVRRFWTICRRGRRVRCFLLLSFTYLLHMLI